MKKHQSGPMKGVGLETSERGAWDWKRHPIFFFEPRGTWALFDRDDCRGGLTLLRNIPSIYCLLRYYAVTPHTSQWILRLLRCYRPLLRHECPNNLSLIMLLRSTFNVVSLLQYEHPKNLSLISYCAVTLRCQCYERPKHPSLKDAKNPLLSFVRFCRMFTWSQGAYNEGLKSCPIAGLRLKQEESESWC